MSDRSHAILPDSSELIACWYGAQGTGAFSDFAPIRFFDSGSNERSGRMNTELLDSIVAGFYRASVGAIPWGEALLPLQQAMSAWVVRFRWTAHAHGAARGFEDRDPFRAAEVIVVGHGVGSPLTEGGKIGFSHSAAGISKGIMWPLSSIRIDTSGKIFFQRSRSVCRSK